MSIGLMPSDVMLTGLIETLIQNILCSKFCFCIYVSFFLHPHLHKGEKKKSVKHLMSNLLFFLQPVLKVQKNEQADMVTRVLSRPVAVKQLPGPSLPKTDGTV